MNEPIVSKELFEQANKNAFRGPKVGYRPRKSCTIYVCGRRVDLNGSGRGYRCNSTSSSGMPECQYSKRNRVELENATLMVAKSHASEKLDELNKLKAIWKRDTKHLKGTDTIENREKKLTEKKMKLYAEYKRGKIDRDTYTSEMKAVSEKLEDIRGHLADIEKRAQDGRYNLISSIEVEKQLTSVTELSDFDPNTLKNVLEHIIVKADGTEEYIWKDLKIV